MCFANEKRTEPLGYEPNVLTTTLSSQNNFKLEKLRSKLNATGSIPDRGCIFILTIIYHI